MELEHRFEVPAGIDTAWPHLLDMEKVAACFPGATLKSSDGDEYTGTVKVKLGPIQLTYAGSAKIVSADEKSHTATIEASGTAARSGSTAAMTVVAVATDAGPDTTAVTMTTTLNITGRPAQFGRGVMVEVGNKILGRFADCLSSKLSAASGEAASTDAAGSAGAAGGADADTAGGSGGTVGAGSSATKSAAHGSAGMKSGSASKSASTSKKADSSKAGGSAKKPAESGQQNTASGAATEPGASVEAEAAAEAEHGPAGGRHAAGSEESPRSASDSASTGRQTYTRVAEPDMSEPIDLLESAGIPVLKRAAIGLGGILAVVLAVLGLRKLFRRS